MPQSRARDGIRRDEPRHAISKFRHNDLAPRLCGRIREMGIVPSEQIIHLVSDADSQLCCVTGLVRRHQLLVQEYGGQSAHFRRDRNVLQASRKTDAFLLIAIDAIAEFLLRDDRTKELEPSPLRVPPIASRHPTRQPIDVCPVVMQRRNDVRVEVDRWQFLLIWCPRRLHRCRRERPRVKSPCPAASAAPARCA